MRTTVLLLVFVLSSGFLFAQTNITTSTGCLVSFRDGPDPSGRTPVYFLATDGKLHRVMDEAAAIRFWGPQWTSRIQWWGDKQGRPTQGHLKDSVRVKGDPITTNTTWLAPFLNKLVVGAMHKDQPDDDDEVECIPITINGNPVMTFNGVVDENSLRAATPDMTEEDRNRFRVQANQRAGLANQMKARVNNNLAVPKQNLTAEYERARQAIKEFDARLRRPSHLIAFYGVPGEVFLLFADGNLSIPIRNGVIDEAEFRAAVQAARKQQRMNLRLMNAQ